MPICLCNGEIIIGDEGDITAKQLAFWHCRYSTAFALGKSRGVVEVEPNSQTLGGYQLDANNDYIHAHGRTCGNWPSDGTTVAKVGFETADDNQGGNETDIIRFQATARWKGDRSHIMHEQSSIADLEIGQAHQWTHFHIALDLSNMTLIREASISVTIAFLRTQSAINKVIVNHLAIAYETRDASMHTPCVKFPIPPIQ
jgi:hypothetical protein